MKQMIFISCIFITITGCTTTYKLSESRSPEKFYEKCKSAVENRNVNVTLDNDSSVFTCDENEIVKDTFYTVKETKTSRYYKISTAQIKDMDYLSNDYKTANITLKDGEKLKAENLSITNDTTKFWGIKTSVMKTMISPLYDVKSIEYKNHWKGVIPGILGGALLGGVLGATGWIFHPMDGGMVEQFDQGTATFGGAFSGLIIGAVVGYIIGFNINYEFR